jgi:hypothetical protein
MPTLAELVWTIGMNQRNLSAFWDFIEGQDLNAIQVGLRPDITSPGLHDHPLGDDHQILAGNHAIERCKIAAYFRINRYLSANEPGVFFWIHKNIKQLIR